MTDFEKNAYELIKKAIKSMTPNDDDNIEIDAAVSSGDNNNSDAVSTGDLQGSLPDNDSYHDSQVDLDALTYCSGARPGARNTAGDPPNCFSSERAYIIRDKESNCKEAPITYEEAMRLHNV